MGNEFNKKGFDGKGDFRKLFVIQDGEMSKRTGKDGEERKDTKIIGSPRAEPI